MSISKWEFGAVQIGGPVTAWRIENAHGASATVLDFGATLQSLRVPGRRGLTDVVLGYDTAAEYERNDGYLGATVGRVSNRIRGSSFRLNGKTYPLAPNDGTNHLHGGLQGFDRQMWQVTPQGDDALLLTRLSPDGEEGYPGNLRVQVTYRLTEQNALQIIYDADCDQDTPVSLTNHSYFNLDGGGSIRHHQLQVFADQVAENDAGCMCTGKLLDVAGTPFDLRSAKPLETILGDGHPQLALFDGCDHNYALSGKKAAVLRSSESGIELTVTTDEPGMQVYTANSLDRRIGKGGASMGPHDAVCLETQQFPDAVNISAFPSPVLEAGCHLHSTTEYAFRLV